MYELTDLVHPGTGPAFKNICAGNGRTKGKPLKTVNWAGITGSHPCVVSSIRNVECWLPRRVACASSGYTEVVDAMIYERWHDALFPSVVCNSFSFASYVLL